MANEITLNRLPSSGLTPEQVNAILAVATQKGRPDEVVALHPKAVEELCEVWLAWANYQ